jgi:hypothetical protein
LKRSSKKKSIKDFITVAHREEFPSDTGRKKEEGKKKFVGTSCAFPPSFVPIAIAVCPSITLRGR